MSIDTPTTPSAPTAQRADAAKTPIRAAYRDALVELMARDPRTVCLDTDTGLFTGVDFGPAAERYLDLGIAEQNLMGTAAGLAAGGARPFVNTMAGFASTRAAEFVKIDIAYNALPVRIAATHSGVSAGHLGPTHHCLEDLAVMRTLPNMTVLVPADATDAAALLAQAIDLPGPVYLRMGRKATPALPEGTPLPELGRISVLRPGAQIVIVAIGPHPVAESLSAADDLAAAGITAGVLNVHTLKPFDTETLLTAVAGADLVVTVEEHWRTGGLGAAVAEQLTEHTPRRLVRIGFPDSFVNVVGSQEELLQHYGISAAGITGAVRSALRR